MMRVTPKSLLISDRVYRLLLAAYPTPFRREFGPEMAQVFRDKCQRRLAQRGVGGLAVLWLHTFIDWIKTAFEQQIEEAFHMSGQQWLIRLGALAALAGGALGLYLAIDGPNSYGNYGWDSPLAPLVPVLFALGFGGALAAYRQQLSTAGWLGALAVEAGLLLMGVGLVVSALWFFIFFGPLVIAPVGALVLGLSLYRRDALPLWWRYFPLLVVAIGLAGFGVELAEEFATNSAPDRGLQLAEALFSAAWIGLGLGLWLSYGSVPDDPQLAA